MSHHRVEEVLIGQPGSSRIAPVATLALVGTVAIVALVLGVRLLGRKSKGRHA